MTMLAILVLPLSMLGFTALAVVLPVGTSSILNPARTASREVLYAYTSATANNGSAFGGLTGNTPFYNTTLGLAMLIGRFMMIVPMLAVAGSLVAKKTCRRRPEPSRPTGGLFVGLLVGVILIIGGLTFFPALVFGPVVEHLAMQARHAVLSITNRDRASGGGTRPLRADADTGLSFLNSSIVIPALGAAFRKLDPRALDPKPGDVRGRGRRRR